MVQSRIPILRNKPLVVIDGRLRGYMWVGMVIEPYQALSQNLADLTKYGSHVYVLDLVGRGELQKLLAAEKSQNCAFLFLLPTYMCSHHERRSCETSPLNVRARGSPDSPR
jgi:hypothetical protein